MILIDAEEFKHKLNNSKYYDTEVWNDICDMLAECKSHTPNYEEEGEIYCPYYTTRMETRRLSDIEMCEVYRLTGKLMCSVDQEIGHCMGTKNMIECYCDGLKERCEHK